MILRQVIHFPGTNSVEATWVDGDGNQVRCHSYADVQMNDLRADLGDDAINYVDLITVVEANIKPPTPLTPEEINTGIAAQIADLERATLMPRATREFMLTFFAATAASQGVDPMTSPAYVKVKALDDQIAALRRAMV